MRLRGDRLREAREKRGLTQNDLAKLCKIGNVQLSRYETGKMDPQVDTLVEIAVQLRVSVDYLVGLTQEPQGLSQNTELNEEELKIITILRHKGKLGVAKMMMYWMIEKLDE